MTTSALRVSRYQMTLHTIGKDFSFFIDDACSILEYRARYKLHYIELVKIFFFPMIIYRGVVVVVVKIPWL